MACWALMALSLVGALGHGPVHPSSLPHERLLAARQDVVEPGAAPSDPEPSAPEADSPSAIDPADDYLYEDDRPPPRATPTPSPRRDTRPTPRPGVTRRRTPPVKKKPAAPPPDLDDDEDAPDSDTKPTPEEKEPFLTPLYASAVTGGVTAAAGCACASIPGALAAGLIPLCGACCFGAFAGVALGGVTGVTSAVLDMVAGQNINVRRLFLAGTLSGGTALVGFLVSGVLVMLASLIVPVPVLLLTGDSGAFWLSMVAVGGVMTLVLFGAVSVLAAVAGAGGYYLGLSE